MPAMIAFPYILLEALTFWGVASWLGPGKAVLWLLAFFFGGLFLAAWEMSSISKKVGSGKIGPGQTAGDLGLVAAGSFLVALPGFVTSILGLLLIFAPTRALIRGLLAKKLRTRIEDFGVRSFEAANSYRQRANYGSFAGGEDSAVVIDEEEIQQWSFNLRPEDFTDPGTGDGRSNQRK